MPRNTSTTSENSCVTANCTSSPSWITGVTLSLMPASLKATDCCEVVVAPLPVPASMAVEVSM